jgi:hypothetical protein
MLVILTQSLSKGKNPRILLFAFLVVIPKRDLLSSLSLPFNCHPSPQAEDLLSAFASASVVACASR